MERTVLGTPVMGEGGRHSPRHERKIEAARGAPQFGALKGRPLLAPALPSNRQAGPAENLGRKARLQRGLFMGPAVGPAEDFDRIKRITEEKPQPIQIIDAP